ncbi:DNA-binding response regulator [Variovorax sp. RO1]|uniref:LuxR C-terminal-related transcriptional regulator n=1 Tax=Variovorax sp. RO1 TaxID=2066034 RepID=UPI000C717E95|nr:response regulator transcription factor [Variovorax sp. RO1]PLC02560.1 DNA-binding response regulator [Variovorax sp. RO1]
MSAFSPQPEAPAMTPPPSPDLPVPVLIVEDDALMQRRIVGILNQLGYANDVLVLAATLADARIELARQPFALVLVDLGLPDGNGVELITQMSASNASMNADDGPGILVISAWSTDDLILNALRAGATGYVLKERDDLELLLSIRSVLRGGAPIDPFIARRILDLTQAPPATPGRVGEDVLTARELQILQLVAEGLTNREIAEQIFLSRHTVECHIKNIYRKLTVSSRTRAVFAARSRGLLA